MPFGPHTRTSMCLLSRLLDSEASVRGRGAQAVPGARGDRARACRVLWRAHRGRRARYLHRRRATHAGAARRRRYRAPHGRGALWRARERRR